MKTNIKNSIAAAIAFIYRYRQSWRVWVTITVLIIIVLTIYTGSALYRAAKTTNTAASEITAAENNRTPTEHGNSSTPAAKPNGPAGANDSKQNPPQSTGAVPSTQDSTKSPGSPSQQSPSKSTNPTSPQQSTSPTTPTNPTIPATPKPSISGQFVPRADYTNWKHVFYDDFDKDAPLGSWGEDWDGNKIVYIGAQSQQWRAYPKSYKDTYDKRPYRSDRVLSVKNSILNFWLHTVDGLPAGANPSPIIASGSQYQTYGRYSARFKVDSPNMNEYYVAWLLWPQSERWPQDGEFDFPEGNLAGNVGGFHHYSGAGSCSNGCQDVANIPANTKFTDWHTYTIEWSPGRVKYILDDTVVLNSTKWVPSGPMRWQLQTETKGNGTSSGNLMLDWVSVWSYRP